MRNIPKIRIPKIRIPKIRIPKIRPFRRLAVIVLQTAAASWLWDNRRDLLAKLTRRRDSVDTTRPEGDRFVPTEAGRGPSPYEAARADEAPRPGPAVAEHMEESASLHRIHPAR